MQAVTRWLVVLVLTLILPAPARAQAPTRKALVGTWLRTMPWKDSTGKEQVETDTLVLHADSTWEMKTVNAARSNGFEPSGCSGWFLTGDSLWFGPPAQPKTVHGRTVVFGYMPIKVSLRNQELTMNVLHPKDPSPKVYQRIGDARPRGPLARCK